MCDYKCGTVLKSHFVDFDMKCDDERNIFPTTTTTLPPKTTLPPQKQQLFSMMIPQKYPYLIVQIENSSIPNVFIIVNVDYYYNYSAVSSQEFLYIRFVENTTLKKNGKIYSMPPVILGQ